MHVRTRRAAALPATPVTPAGQFDVDLDGTLNLVRAPTHAGAERNSTPVGPPSRTACLRVRSPPPPRCAAHSVPLRMVAERAASWARPVRTGSWLRLRRAFASIPVCSRARWQYEYYDLLLDVCRWDGASDEVRAVFDYCDRNRTGRLDYLELQEALRGYGFDATVGECVDLVRHYDDGGVGTLSLPEFAQLVEHLVPYLHDAPLAYEPPAYVAKRPLPVALPPRPVSPVVVLGSGAYAPPPPLRPAELRSALCTRGPRVAYMQPLVSATVRAIFEHYDEGRRGYLDAARARSALLHLGLHVTLGETAALVRRYGGYPPASLHTDTVCSLAQFGEIVNHVRALGMAALNPLLATTSRLSPASRAAAAGADIGVDGPRSPLAWYGHRPLSPDRRAPWVPV